MSSASASLPPVRRLQLSAQVPQNRANLTPKPSVEALRRYFGIITSPIETVEPAGAAHGVKDAPAETRCGLKLVALFLAISHSAPPGASSRRSLSPYPFRPHFWDDSFPAAPQTFLALSVGIYLILSLREPRDPIP